MKKKQELPDWVAKHKEAGTTVRKRGDSYILLRVSSKRVKGKKYPMLQQEYMGVITKEKGLVRKVPSARIDRNPMSEFGLSAFILHTFGRRLERSVYGLKGERAMVAVRLAIVNYVMGGISEASIELCAITFGREKALLEESKRQPANRISSVTNKISAMMRELVPDKAKREAFETRLRYTVTPDKGHAAFEDIPKELLEIEAKKGGERP